MLFYSLLFYIARSSPPACISKPPSYYGLNNANEVLQVVIITQSESYIRCLFYSDDVFVNIWLILRSIILLYVPLTLSVLINRVCVCMTGADASGCCGQQRGGGSEWQEGQRASVPLGCGRRYDHDVYDCYEDFITFTEFGGRTSSANEAQLYKSQNIISSQEKDCRKRYPGAHWELQFSYI